MTPVESGPVIEHIEDAKSWLNKACAEYDQANPVRGELILNLAQAEVKHAWELSHQQFVIHGNQQVKSRIHWHYLVPAAAVLVILIGLIGSNIMLKFNTTSSTARQPAATNQGLDSIPGPTDQVTAGNLTSERLKPVATPLTGESSRGNLVSNNNAPGDGSRVTASDGPRVQPVTEILIDEEALTREASHTLRDGK